MAKSSDIETRPAGDSRRDNVATAGLSPDTWNNLEAYRERNNVASRSEAVRRLIQKGLEAEESDDSDDTESWTNRLVAAAGVLFVSGWPALYVYNGDVGAAITLVAMFTIYVLFQPQLDRALDLATAPLKSLYSRLTNLNR